MNRHERALLHVGVALCLTSVSLLARAAVQFDPSVSAGIAYTDNVTLAARDEEHESVLQLIPSFNLLQQSGRITSQARYQLQGYHYNRRSESEVYHQLDARLVAALQPDRLFFEVGADRSQSIVDPELVIPFSNLPISRNRIDRDSLYMGPSFQYPFGANATVRGSYQRNWVRYDHDAERVFGYAQDVDQDTAQLSVDNYRRGQGFTWAARYQSLESDYGFFLPWQYRQAALELGGWINRRVRLFATAGRESAWDQPFDDSLEDDFWEIGTAVSAGQNFSAEFGAGERSFGSSARGQMQVRLRRGSLSVSYVEQPTTAERNPFRRAGLLVPDDPEDYLARAGNPERFISKRLQWQAQWDFRRSGISFRIFDTKREERMRLDGLLLPDEHQEGRYVSGYFDLGPRTRLTADGQWVDRTFGSANTREYMSLGVSARRELGPRTSARFELRHARDESGFEGSGLNYTSNLASLMFTWDF